MKAVPMKFIFAVICAVRGRAHRVIPTPRPTRCALVLRFPGKVLPTSRMARFCPDFGLFQFLAHFLDIFSTRLRGQAHYALTSI